MTVIHRNLRRLRRSILTLEPCESRVLMATGPSLGGAASFAVLGGTTVTNTGTSEFVGNVGVSPGTSITGFPPGVINGAGTLDAGDAVATQAEADLAKAYAILVAEPVDTYLSGQNLGALMNPLTPGVYNFVGAAQLTGKLTLDAQGDPNAVFVIQIGTTLTTASASSVVLINNAHAQNVFWQVGSSATIGPDTAFQGNILANTSIVLNTSASISPGRALAINAAVTMDTNAISNYVTTPLTITTNAQSQVYGATQPNLTVSYSGFINGDTSASLTTQPTVTTTANANSHVGTYAINASGAADPNYVISYVEVNTLAITAAPLTITADNQSKVYGAALPKLTATYSGFVNGDTSGSLTPPPTLTTTASANSHVGTYGINISGAMDSDYTINQIPGTLTITAAPLTISADNQSQVYGAALPKLTATYTGLVNGDMPANLTPPPTLATTASANSHVGSYAINASGAMDSDYTINQVPGTLTITAAPLTITADNQSKVYGAALPKLTATYSGFVNGDTSGSLTPPPTLTTTASANSHVGTYGINISGAMDSDYTINQVPGTLTITAAPLTITADNQSQVYGAALPKLTATYTGLVNGDMPANLTPPPTLATTASANSHVGSYAINISGAMDSDYTINQVPGTLTITAAPLTISADNQSKVYGAPLPTLTASYSGFVNGDTATILSETPNSSPTITTTATASSSVAGSPYVISDRGAVDPDYSISYRTGLLTVTPTAGISGRVYLDLNASGTPDPGEPGLAGRVVFLDLSHDGKLDAGDTTATTDANGNFTLINGSTGTGPVLEATDQDANHRFVIDQTVTNVNGTVTIGVVPISALAPVPVVPNPFSASPSSDKSTSYVQSLYHAVLKRVGGDSEVATWLVKLDSGMTRQQVALGFVNSLEHRKDQVATYYKDFLNRTPDPSSAFWVNELQSGVSEERVVESFLNSPEYQAAHQDSTLFIHDLYIDVLGRQGEATGVASWQAALASGASRESIVARFVESAEADDQIVTSFYTAFLHRPRETGTTSTPWVTMLEAANGSATDVAVGILASPEFDQDATTPTR